MGKYFWAKDWSPIHTSLYENRHGIKYFPFYKQDYDILSVGEIKPNDEPRAGTRFTSNYIPRSVLLAPLNRLRKH